MRQLVLLALLWGAWRVLWRLGVCVGLYYWLLYLTQRITSFGL